MLPIPYFIIIAISFALGYLGKCISDKMKTDEKIISLWTNGRSIEYIANKLDLDYEYVDQLISAVIYHGN